MKVLVDYPSEEEEFVIVQRVTGSRTTSRRWRAPSSSSAAKGAARLHVEPAGAACVRLRRGDARSERYGIKGLQKYLTYGASPRASISLIEGARALAFLRGRDYALPQDVTDLVPDVIRHRLVLSYEALSEGLTADEVIGRIMAVVRAPEKPLETHVNVQSV
jgi:MoxR-like ATPase